MEIVNKKYLKFKGNVNVQETIKKFTKNKFSEAYFIDNNNILKAKIVLTEIINQNKKYLI